jgi:hypothetical protein
MYREHNAGHNHNIKVGNKSFESLVQFKYFETTPTHKICIRDEIQSRQNLGNACYHWVKLFFVFHFAMQKYEDRNTQNYNFACIVSGFRRGINEIFALLGCFAA